MAAIVNVAIDKKLLELHSYDLDSEKDFSGTRHLITLQFFYRL